MTSLKLKLASFDWLEIRILLMKDFKNKDLYEFYVQIYLHDMYVPYMSFFSICFYQRKRMQRNVTEINDFLAGTSNPN